MEVDPDWEHQLPVANLYLASAGLALSLWAILGTLVYSLPVYALGVAVAWRWSAVPSAIACAGVLLLIVALRFVSLALRVASMHGESGLREGGRHARQRGARLRCAQHSASCLYAP